MIDFDKLKLAHEICFKDLSLFFIIGFGMERGCYEGMIRLYDSNKDDYIYQTNSLDELISKLQELTQKKPKYTIGQEVWFHFNDMLKHYHVDAVDKDADGQWSYHLWNFYIKEDDLFLSKKDLIEERIDYWKNLLSEELEQHISPYCYPPFEGEIKGFNFEVPHQEPLFAPMPCEHETHFNIKRCNCIVTSGISGIKTQTLTSCIKCNEPYTIKLIVCIRCKKEYMV